MGVATDQIKKAGHIGHELFGMGKDHDRRYWTSVLRQSLVANYITKDIESYGMLRIGPKAKDLDKTTDRIMFCLDRDFSDADDDEASATGGTAALDEVALSNLRDIRAKMGDKLKLAPHVIFSDPALEAMATFYPINMDELRNIPGVGEGKAHKFGQPFVDYLAKYVEENEIERPNDLVVKSMPNKSSDKIALIQSIDRRMDLEDIAESRNMDMGELMQAIEDIVEFGTKLNLDYYIEQNVDPDVVDEIYTYFKEEAESDSLEESLTKLGQDYEEMEIRLVRIKFLSEVAN